MRQETGVSHGSAKDRYISRISLLEHIAFLQFPTLSKPSLPTSQQSISNKLPNCIRRIEGVNSCSMVRPSAPSSSLYTSLPLPNDETSIRLLTINPSLDRHAPVICSLHLAKIDSASKYETLSYCWGDAAATESVSVNGVDILITKNLATALLMLRLPNESRIIWMDAICIDQNNVAEKNFQVPLMRLIYVNCWKTTIWLGESDKESRQAFSSVQHKNKTYSRTLTSVLRRPWWRRVWIIQEVAFAPIAMVQCGTDLVEWGQLLEAVSNISQLGSMVNPSTSEGSTQLHPSFYPLILDSTRNRVKEGKLFSIREALRSFQPFDATHSVDKIYGLIGLLEEPELIKVDYGKAVKDVFQDTALTIINHSRCLDIFLDCLQSTSDPKTPDLPSWVPDWSSSDDSMDNRTVSAKEIFSASQGTEIIEAVSKSGVLRISGHIIGVVAEVGREIPTIADIRERYWPSGRLLPHRRAFAIPVEITEIFQDWKEVMCRTKQSCTSLSDTYPTGETLFEAFYCTLQKTLFSDTDNSHAFDKWCHSTEWYMNLFQWYGRNIANRLPWLLAWLVSGPFYVACSFILGVKFLRGQLVMDAPMESPDASRQSWVPGRTDGGLFGLFPAPSFMAPDTVASRPGDAIAIFKGGARPIVIRRVGDCWRLIGDAYVHGIMYGAALEEEKCVDMSIV
jgi:hypothetical protein